MNNEPILHEDDYNPLPNRRETMHALNEHIPSIEQQIRTQLHGVANVWQPSDFLPDFSQDEASQAAVKKLQTQARNLPPEILAVLIGDAVTEEGLPTFTSRLFTSYGLPTGTKSDVHSHPGDLQEWYRKWTAEEHRHGVLLNGWLRVSGRVDMGAYERTVQLFLEDGMDIQTSNDPYRGFVYTSFQELATQRSHGNVAKLAKKHDNHILATMCGQIAADEGYHAKAYIEFVRFIYKRDPNQMILAHQYMLQKGIVMPAHNMREVDPSGTVLQPGDTYKKFSNIAQHIGVYTSKDYAEISAQLLEAWGVGTKSNGTWEVGSLQGLNEEGQNAQQKILQRQKVLDAFAERQRKKDPWEVPQFTWLIQKTPK